MRALIPSVCVLLALPAVAQVPVAAEEVFAERPSVEAQAWLDDAVASYNEKMTDLKRDWLVNVSGARTDTRRRKVIVETVNGTVVFDAKVIGGFGKRDGQWLWVWGWASSGHAVNFRLLSVQLHDIGSSLKLPFVTTAQFYSKSSEFPFLASAVALKVYGGVGVHRVRVPIRGAPYDVYYLLSNPRREAQ